MYCSISGSFRKFYKEICQTHDIFEENGITVLSPKKSRIMNPDEKFIRLETDSPNKEIIEIENDHLGAIKKI